jgi:putative nucleotidyltransferase with HDIG domain
MMTAGIREYVREQCGRKGNVFGPSFFDEHFAVVAGFAGRLARRLGADEEIVELAAYLHDISAVRDAAASPDHASLSAELARRLPSERGYPSGRVAAVVQAIASHSSPLPLGGGLRKRSACRTPTQRRGFCVPRTGSTSPLPYARWAMRTGGDDCGASSRASGT